MFRNNVKIEFLFIPAPKDFYLPTYLTPKITLTQVFAQTIKQEKSKHTGNYHLLTGSNQSTLLRLSPGLSPNLHSY